MKKETKQWNGAVPALLLAAALSLTALLVFRFAEVSAQTTAYPTASDTPAPMVIEADNAGNVVLRGRAASVNGNSMTVESWGGTWTVRTGAASGIMPAAGNGRAGDLSAISVGDLVGIDGTFASDQGMTIDATFVRDWTTDPLAGAFETNADTSPAMSVTLDSAVGADTPTNEASTITYSGTVDRVDDSSFTFTDDFDSTYTVDVDDTVAVVDRDGTIRSLEDIDAGDDVELDGAADGDRLSTAMVRITSE